ncbi:MAG: hypothetical protein QOD84_2399 [Acidobacteriaceae bacterium]|jgi:hypothetical protein
MFSTLRAQLLPATALYFLETMTRDEEKMVQAQNLTRQALYYLQSARARLDMRRSSALSGLLPYVPTMSDVALRLLISNKLQASRRTKSPSRS